MRNFVLLFMCFLAACDSDISDRAIGEVRAASREPDRVQFRNVELIHGFLVCGEYNSTNQYGGYNGFMPFTYMENDDGTSTLMRPEDLPRLPESAAIHAVNLPCAELRSLDANGG